MQIVNAGIGCIEKAKRVEIALGYPNLSQRYESKTCECAARDQISHTASL